MSGEHIGHRKRMLKKLEQGDVCEHELLEILLFPLLPRKNTNDLAHRLLSKFGSLSGIYSASIDELKTVDGVGESVAANLHCLGKINRLLRTNKDTERRVNFYELNDFLSYTRMIYGKVKREVADLYFLDGDGHVYEKWRFSDGAPYSVSLDPDEFSKRILEGKPSGVVLVHNHPGGIAAASSMDDRLTRQFQVVCSLYGALLCDHIIYADSGAYSYYLSGKLQEISRDCNIMNDEWAKTKRGHKH